MGVTPGGVARLHVLVHSKNFDEEKLGKVERKVERQLQVGVCLRTVGRSSVFSSSCPTLHYVQFVKYIFPRNRTTSN